MVIFRDIFVYFSVNTYVNDSNESIYNRFYTELTNIPLYYHQMRTLLALLIRGQLHRPI